MAPSGWWKEIQNKAIRRGGVHVMNVLLRSLSWSASLQPSARPSRHGVEVLRDIPYTEEGGSEHQLDIYRPIDRSKPCPVLFYVHGGAFQILSKETHWVMALQFAAHGYMVVTINYRLAPKHRYPAGIEDVSRALRWTLENAQAYGGDLDRFVLSGESAGANLVTSLTVASCYENTHEAWAQDVWDLNPPIRAVIPACGVFQVSNQERYRGKGNVPNWFVERLVGMERSYLPRSQDVCTDLADPVNWLERGAPPQRPLPPFFLPVGLRDPLLYDTRRLQAALTNLGCKSEAKYYKGGIHAFHALVWRELAKECWKDQLRFFHHHLQTDLSTGGSETSPPLPNDAFTTNAPSPTTA